MKKKYLIFSGLTFLALTANAQKLQEGYIDWGKTSEHFSTALSTWSKGDKVTEDDNFFISRVKPKQHFRNAATQVNQQLDANNDKKLVYWVPVGTPPNNALPNGVFDSEVFPMWSYITHYGNWSAPFVRMPGNFADVAHKNGIGVSVVAGVPYGGLSDGWRNELTALTGIGAEKMADFLDYYGVDGLGYNSEFSTGNQTLLENLRTFHSDLYRLQKASGKNPLFENFWYDGTNDNGNITFDQGLGSHNEKTFGDSDNPRVSMFFNYNWNNVSRMEASIAKAESMGRDPLDLYCGFNMQGAEPKYGIRWPLLEGRNLSIGLWGAHSENMPFESRGELGALSEVKQRTYMLRVERWFSSGSRNPVNDLPITSAMNYNANNYSFFGMSKFMTARSSLKWDLSEEPFITYFNLGNGKFFNWGGQRQSNGEWYNIGIQDYLPTWRWWFSSKFIGRDVKDVPASGLDAEFIWDDAWMGGSLLRIHGTNDNEYLHMFKTEFRLAAGDVITVRYKVMGGSTDMTLALSARGNENTVLGENYLKVIESSSIEVGEWVEKTFRIASALNVLNGKDLAMVALHFKNAKDLNLHLGEFSIVRGTATSAVPAKPVITTTKVLVSNHSGVDGKIIFEMPNDKGNEVCYNLDVKTSMFKLYAQQEGKDPVLVGATTSWAGMYFAFPIDYEVSEPKIRFGVSAVSLDMKSESDIAWDDYLSTGKYIIDDNIQITKTTIKPGEDFEVYYVDPKHEAATWEILDSKGNSVMKKEGVTLFSVPEGLSETGNYALVVTGPQANVDGDRVETTRKFPGYIQITSKSVGALPQILSLKANGEEADVHVGVSEPINMTYTGREADGSSSRGLNTGELGFGFKAGEMELEAHKPFTIAFWVKVNSFNAEINSMLHIRDKKEGWPMTDWGFMWAHIKKDGSINRMAFRGKGIATDSYELHYNYDKSRLEVGLWTHLAYVFDYDAAKNFKFTFYINGEKQEVTSYDGADDGYKVHTGEPDWWPRDQYGLREAHVIAVGTASKDVGGLDGTLDNFQCWNKALTAEEVLATMGDVDKNNIPENMVGYWTYETEPNEEGAFMNEGSKEGVLGGLHSYTAGAGEGEGNFKWESASYAPGCPFVAGTSYPVTTSPKWTINKGNITNASGSDTEGSAQVTFAKNGIYSATLTLENGWGTDSKTFEFITVGNPDGVEEVNLEAELKAYPNPFIDHVNVKFTVEGIYTVRICDMNGTVVCEKAQQVAAGEMIRINVNVGGGTYIGQVLKDGKLVRAVKLLKK